MEEPSATPNIFEIVTTTAGAVSIRDNLTGEIMHNPVGPWKEANSLYIDQSELKTKLCAVPSEQTFVLFDVGLGAGTNALAALHCFDQNQKQIQGQLKIVSFEKNLELIKFALLNSREFDYFQGWESAILTLLENGVWSQGSLTWELRTGDFLELIESETERPHLIFFDPYSPKVNQEMWTTDCFKKVFACIRPVEESETVLYTYSQATPIRSALLAAGFYVGYGRGTGLKNETTIAASRLCDLQFPLDQRWLKRWKDSHTPYPYDCSVSQQEELRIKILQHPQFHHSPVPDLQ
jgi:tRNA U34 5-methylaminomethyl-2-thiouridine-forming methyltransferase MnmC